MIEQRLLQGVDSRFPEIEAAGGLFVLPPGTDPQHARRMVAGCGVRALEVHTRDLSPLEGLPLEFLTVLATAPDVGPVSTLTRLRSLALDSWTGTLRLDMLPRLEWFAATELAKGQLDQVLATRHDTLHHVSIGRFSDSDVRRLAVFPQLTHAEVVDSRAIEGLAGIEALAHLRHLELVKCRSLRSLEGIEGATALRCVRIESCNAVTDLAPLARLPRLRAMVVDGRSIPPLLPLAGHPRLSHLWLIGGRRQRPELTGLLENATLQTLQSSREVWLRMPHGWLHIPNIYAMSAAEQDAYERAHAARAALLAW